MDLNYDEQPLDVRMAHAVYWRLHDGVGAEFGRFRLTPDQIEEVQRLAEEYYVSVTDDVLEAIYDNGWEG